jgi:hypothetical protein
MRFVVDAHLPRRLCGVLARHSHEAGHSLDLAAGNASSDEDINRISLDDRRVVISKDTDFFFSHTHSWATVEAAAGQDRQHFDARLVRAAGTQPTGDRSGAAEPHIGGS